MTARVLERLRRGPDEDATDRPAQPAGTRGPRPALRGPHEPADRGAHAPRREDDQELRDLRSVEDGDGATHRGSGVRRPPPTRPVAPLAASQPTPAAVPQAPLLGSLTSPNAVATTVVETRRALVLVLATCGRTRRRGIASPRRCVVFSNITHLVGLATQCRDLGGDQVGGGEKPLRNFPAGFQVGGEGESSFRPRCGFHPIGRWRDSALVGPVVGGPSPLATGAAEADG